MRTCLIIVGVIVALAAAGVGFAAYSFNQQYGYSMAEPVSFTTQIEENTRIQAVLNVDTLRDYAVELLPANIPALPSWLPYDLHELMENMLPRELAILAGANWNANAIDLKVFANERRVGPVIVEQLREQRILSNITQVQWEPELFQLEQRGVITARGKMALPNDAEQIVLNNAGTKQGHTVDEITGNNLLEIIVDGHDGDLLALVGAMAKGQGQTLEEALLDPNASKVLTNISNLYADANLTGADELTINIKITLFPNAPKEASAMINMGVNFLGFPAIKTHLEENYALTLDKKDGKSAKWVDPEHFEGTYLISGFRPQIEQQIATALATNPPPTES